MGTAVRETYGVAQKSQNTKVLMKNWSLLPDAGQQGTKESCCLSHYSNKEDSLNNHMFISIRGQQE